MKRTLLAGLAILLLPVLPAALAAQQPASANPTTDAAHRLGSRLAGFLEAAAEQVPAEKLSYKPTEAQMTFADIWGHLVEGNYSICAGIGGMEAPSLPAPDGSASKDELVKALQKSFAFCDKAFENTDDSRLGEQVSLGFMNGTRALAMFVYVEDLADHYAQVATYMRLNDMLPPSAQRGD